MRLAAVLPLYAPFERDENWTALFLKTLQDLKNLDGKIQFDIKDKRRLNFKLLKEEESFILEKIKLESGPRTKGYLQISIKLKGGELSGNKRQIFIIKNLFLKRVQDFILAVNIARMGLFETGAGKIFLILPEEISESIDDVEAAIHGIKVCVNRCSKQGWPTFKIMSITRTWNWILKLHSSLDSISNCSSGRAVNAFSRLLYNPNLQDEFISSWIGIEALFSSGREDLLQQMDEKVQLTLGKRETFKNRFKEVYGIRSRLVHGQLDIPNIHSFADATKAYNKYMETIIDATSLSVGVLLATLQYLAARRWYSLEFERKFTLKKKNLSKLPSSRSRKMTIIKWDGEDIEGLALAKQKTIRL